MAHLSPLKACVMVLIVAAAGGVAAADDVKEAVGEKAKPPWPHVRVDREAGVVEVDAKVVLDNAEWLELIVCTVGSREYESIAATEARPSHIHLALMTLGLQPGNPMSWQRDEAGELKQIKPAGPAVTITVAWEKDGQKHETPANELVKDNTTGKTMPGSTWLFSGSAMVEHDGDKFYMADVNGTVVSLVNFGDDILARDTTLTNQTDEGQWVANTDALPPIHTPVTIRITPVKAKVTTADDR